MYHDSIWLRYGLNVTGMSARSAKPAASTCPVLGAPSTGSSVVSRPAASSSARITGAGRRGPGVARVVHHVQLERLAERRSGSTGRLPCGPAPTPASSAAACSGTDVTGKFTLPPAPITVVDVDDVGTGIVVGGTGDDGL